ncbi:hypothetical protein AMECASPLE_016546 [Ameca splendens]|uniref:Uncharacterized protein n=1 Tax=Ameca splendens TaxID=208324 RepID=A0ABV1A9F6_9TELE
MSKRPGRIQDNFPSSLQVCFYNNKSISRSSRQDCFLIYLVPGQALHAAQSDFSIIPRTIYTEFILHMVKTIITLFNPPNELYTSTSLAPRESPLAPSEGPLALNEGPLAPSEKPLAWKACEIIQF